MFSFLISVNVCFASNKIYKIVNTHDIKKCKEGIYNAKCIQKLFKKYGVRPKIAKYVGYKTKQKLYLGKTSDLEELKEFWGLPNVLTLSVTNNAIYVKPNDSIYKYKKLRRF
jgi:hypothetical protein